MNSREKSFLDFVELYEESFKFKKWIKGVPNDSNLVEEYYKSIYTNAWADKLPKKTVRFILFTAAGLGVGSVGGFLIGTLASIGVGAFDNFILDKLIKGWKPNQFINNDFKSFMKE